jgi:ABC-2 type transport system permease protein
MSGFALAVRQIGFENRAFWRNPAAAFFTVILPLMFLVLFNAIFEGDRVLVRGRDAEISAFYVPGIAALSVVSACYTNMGMMVSIARDMGQLKRVRGTPLPHLAYLGARIAQSIFVAVLLVAVVTISGAVFYDIAIPTDTFPAFAVTILVGSAAFCALGLALTGIIPNADAAPAITNGTILPLLFISNVFIPLSDPPEWLDTLGNLFPVKHFAEALQAVYDPNEDGAGFEWGHLAVVAAWGLGGFIFALRFFTWEPRR